MSELNAEQIIKALECCCVICYCNTCPYYKIGEHKGICSRKMAKDAVAFIRNLTSDNEKIGIQNFDLVCELSRIKEDTVREMQKNLKEYLDTFYNTGEDALLDIPDLIDQIAKEMLEGEK